MPILLAYIAVLAVTAPAQQSGASLSGTVEDFTGASIPGVNVTLRGDLTSFNATSDVRGAYAFESVPAGTYRLLTAPPGFVAKSLNLTLSEGEKISQRIQLAVGLAMGCGPNACCVAVSTPIERSISGVVVDARGRVIRNAIVSLYGAAISRQRMMVGTDGSFEFKLKHCGALMVAIEADRYSTSEWQTPVHGCLNEHRTVSLITKRH
jgi:hypothetical protein